MTFEDWIKNHFDIRLETKYCKKKIHENFVPLSEREKFPHPGKLLGFP